MREKTHAYSEKNVDNIPFFNIPFFPSTIIECNNLDLTLPNSITDTKESITLLLCYQPAITCSKLTIVTIEQGVEHVQS